MLNRNRHTNKVVSRATAAVRMAPQRLATPSDCGSRAVSSTKPASPATAGWVRSKTVTPVSPGRSNRTFTLSPAPSVPPSAAKVPRASRTSGGVSDRSITRLSGRRGQGATPAPWAVSAARVKADTSAPEPMAARTASSSAATSSGSMVDCMNSDRRLDSRSRAASHSRFSRSAAGCNCFSSPGRRWVMDDSADSSTFSARASITSLVEPGTGMEMPSALRMARCLCSSTSSTVSSMWLSAQ